MKRALKEPGDLSRRVAGGYENTSHTTYLATAEGQLIVAISLEST